MGVSSEKRKQSIAVSEENALNGAVKNWIIYPQKEELYDLLLLFANRRQEIENFLRSLLSEHGIKWYVSAQVEMYRETPDGTVYTEAPHFRGLTYSSLSNQTFNTHELNECFQKISASLENYLRNASGWTIRKVLHLKIHSVIYSPLRGSSFIPLPSSLKRSGSVLNIENEDQKSFLWSILVSLHPAYCNPQLVENYQAFEREINMNGIEYPVILSKIDKFENQNQIISINVFAFEENEILPLKLLEMLVAFIM